MNDDELDRLLATRERPVPLRPFAAVGRRSRATPLLAAAAVAAAIVVGSVAGVRLGELREQNAAASPSPAADATATPHGAVDASPSASVQPTPSPSPAAGGRIVENRVLGYRLTLPEDGYQRSDSLIRTATGERGGVDYYTQKTDEQLRQDCERDAPHIGPGTALPTDIVVDVRLDVGAASAYEWVTTPRVSGGQPMSSAYAVERTTVAGHEAVRLTLRASASAVITRYVIRANDRIYEIAPGYGGADRPAGWLDGIARSFVAIAPEPFPSRPPQDPRAEAQKVADALAAAFAAKDPDAVARVLPRCHFSTVHTIRGEHVGMGPLNRSVPLFTRGLRDAFARGLVVTVDRTLRPADRWGPDAFLVASEWREGGRTTQVDLVVADRRAEWRWWYAVVHIDGTEPQCVAYPSPWHRPESPGSPPCPRN